MFENFSDEELRKLNQAWKNEAGEGNRLRSELQDKCWYPAIIHDMQTGVKDGKARVTLVFDVQGNRLVKDFWLTQKGIFVCKRFLKKLGVEADGLEDLNEFRLWDLKCEVLVSQKEIRGKDWFEIEDVQQV